MSEATNDEMKQLLINLIEEENDNDYVIGYFRTIWPMDKVAATFTESFEEYMLDKFEDYFNDEKDDTRSVEDVLTNFVKIAEKKYWEKKKNVRVYYDCDDEPVEWTTYSKPFKRGES